MGVPLITLIVAIGGYVRIDNGKNTQKNDSQSYYVPKVEFKMRRVMVEALEVDKEG